jgi:hypothetical protein
LRYVLNKSSAIRYFVEGGFGTYFSLSSEDKRLVTVMMGNSAPPIIRNEALFEKGELQSPQFLFWGGAGISYKKLSTGLRYEYQPALLNLSGMTSPIHTIGWTVGYHFNSF